MLLAAVGVVQTLALRAETFDYAKDEMLTKAQVTLPSSHLSLGGLLALCEKQTDFRFFYMKSELSLETVINFTPGGKLPLSTVLNVASNQAGIVFKRKNRQIAVRPRHAPDSVPAPGSSKLIEPDNGEITTMGSFVVSAYNEQIEKSLDGQRDAETLSSVLTAEKIGTFPDRNTAEALQRLAGLAVARDLGEGRYIVMRGLNTEYNSTSLDGAQIAATDSGTRQIGLDTLPSDSIGSIKVTKVSTPDMPGDGMGGSVQIKSRSAFDAKGTVLSVYSQGQYSDYLSSIRGVKTGGAYGDVFAKGKLGVMLSGSWQYRPYTLDQIDVANETGWAGSSGVPKPVASPSNGQSYWAMGPDLSFRRYQLSQKRKSLSANIEFKPNATSLFYVRALYSAYDTKEWRWTTNVPLSNGTLTALGEGTGTYSAMRRLMVYFRERFRNYNLNSVTTGGSMMLGKWQVEGNLGYSEGKEARPRQFEMQFRHSARDQTWSYSFDRDFYQPDVTLISGPSPLDPATYNENNRMRITNLTAVEKNQIAALDLNRSLLEDTQTQVSLKLGSMIRHKVKTNEQELYNYAVPSSLTFSSVADTINPFPYFASARISADKALAAFYNNRSAFTPTRDVSNSTLNDWEVKEDVLSAYAMATARFAQKFTVIGGLRVEQTNTDSLGYEMAGTAVRPANGKSNYTNYLPGVHLRYNLTPKVVFRSSWSKTLARAPFNQIAISRSYDPDDASGTVTQGNPALKALQSGAWDASAEYYFNKTGMVSIAGFYKDISNFTYRTLIPKGDPLTGRDLSTYVNGPSAKLKGLELAYQQQLPFLPAPLNGLGVIANLTLIRSSANYPTRTDTDIPLIGQSNTVGNIGLTYERQWFYYRIALNYRSPRLDERVALGSTAQTDQYIDDDLQVDMSCTFRLSKHVEIYGEWLNVNRQTFRYYEGTPARFVRRDIYGSTVNFGARWRL